MAHSGQGTRTPRTRAQEIGTNPVGFTGGVDMEGDPARAGHPPALGLPCSQYKEQPPAVGGSPSPHSTPFALGNK